ncbi:MAG: transcriptional repressor LexA [Planctomycetota bacterium]|nr:transcriptional repressor LexA [Planctomycetota bacterium]MEE3218829.1 transcriptional repressor LexA [Planctomycetota bacterium]
MEDLTKKQRRVYEFIREKIQSRGYGPTVREIGDHFDIRSPNGVMCHLKALERKGVISRAKNMSRAIRLTAAEDDRGLPLIGEIAAGVLHEAIEQDERIDFDGIFNRRDCAALRVRGDSMIGDGVMDGDYVVIKRQQTARKGQMVVAITDSGEATLKRWFPEANRIRLQPANPSMKPIFVKDARVLGVVVGVVRAVVA